MALTAGTKLGPYEILVPLGVGGMGEVYKARDKRLNRVVAIKVLRSDSAPSASLAERFIREAKSASALNHPNIVSIYDVFRHEDVDCLVMEYVTGATIQALIPRAGMPWKEAVRIAVQVADGLRRAHSAGIIHRDIKPSNVMVQEGGPVKILDFGLATLSASAVLADDDDTLTDRPLTKEGVVVGTISYMSPEQAQGKPVDARSDIFSFGSMLYEMLAGRPAFKEDSKVGTLAAILHSDPTPLASPGVPQPLLRVLSRCLQKKPEDRWQDIGDVQQLLEDVLKDCQAPADAESGARGAASRARQFLWPAIAALCAVAALLEYYTPQRWPGSGASSRADNDAVLRMLTTDGGLTGYPAISRDGKFVAFASDRSKENNLDIWVQQIGGGDPIRLTSDPADESDPDFSPDGGMIAFRSEKDGGGIYTVPALGGTPVLLAPLGRNPRFSPDGRWVAYSMGGEALSNPGSAGVFIISTRGGVPRPIHAEMATATHPVWAPGSDRVLVLGRQDGKAPAREQLDWWILPIEGGAPQRSGVFARLQAQDLIETKFPQTFPIPLDWREEGVGDRILFNALSGEADNLWEIRLQGAGTAQRLTLGPGLQRHASWSADGRRLIFAAEELYFNVWVQPLDAATGASRGSPTRLTDEVSEELTPSISWDGTQIAYERHGPDHWSLFIRNRASDRERKILSSRWLPLTARLSGDGVRVLYTDDSDLLSIPSAGGTAEKLCDRCGTAMGASTDGREILYEPPENEDVLMYDAARRTTVKLALRPSPDLILSGSRFSPDGKWVAFHALRNATNSAQIWIAPTGPFLPVPRSEWIAVTDGSKLERAAAWSADGRFLYFVSERDGFRCIWARPLNALTKKPSGEAFPVRHFHSARFSLRHFGTQGYLAGLSAGEGALVFSMGELKGNVWLEQRGR